MEFTIHTDPIELSHQVAPALQRELAARLPARLPRSINMPDVEYIIIELDGKLVRPAPGTPGLDEVVIDAAEAVLPEGAGCLIWLILSDNRSTLIYWRVNKNDPDVSGGPAYFPPY